MAMPKPSALRTAGLAGALVLLLTLPAAAGAATERSVSEAGTDTGDCSITACATIQYAVDQAVAGDTVAVAAGDYVGGVLIDKALTLEGVRAGVDARGRTGEESTVTASGMLAGFRLTAPVPVVVDGFSFVGNADYGLTVSADASGHAIRNNRFEGNDNGLFLQSNGAQRTVVQRNSFADNGDDGIFSGNPIGTSNALIADNDFTGHGVGAIVLAGAGGDGVEIRGNSMVDDSSIAAFDVSNLTIAGNVSSNPNGSSIYLGGGVGGATVTGNVLTDNAAGGAVVVDDAVGYGPNSGVQVHANQLRRNAIGIEQRDGATTDATVLRDNAITGNGQGAVNRDAAVALAATCNWWGAAGGPSGAGPGPGDSVSAGTTFQPWLTAEPPSACNGPLPPPANDPPATTPPTSPTPDPPVEGPFPLPIEGTPGDDELFGTAAGERLAGGAGDDRLLGGDGDDRMTGGAGDDVVGGQDGDDRVFGRTGNDKLGGGTGDDRLDAGDGRDRLFGGDGEDVLLGGTGSDRLFGSNDDDTLVGGAGDDRLTGGPGRDRIRGGTGDDVINARDGLRDRISCGPGRDFVRADRFDRVGGDCERLRRGRVR